MSQIAGRAGRYKNDGGWNHRWLWNIKFRWDRKNRKASITETKQFIGETQI